MDIWYITCGLMLFIESVKKNDYCRYAPTSKWTTRAQGSAGAHRTTGGAGMQCPVLGGRTQY